jgi:hypothetical protein
MNAGPNASSEHSQAANKAGFADAIETLAHERSLAEQGVSFLKRYAPQDIEGRALYAQAKAESDGLIERLLADLAQGREPKPSSELSARLERAVEERLAFSRRVDAVLKRAVPEGAKPGWEDALAKSAGELVKQIFGGVIAIWHEWRSGSAERRRDMATRVEAQRWKPFADIPAAV